MGLQASLRKKKETIMKKQLLSLAAASLALVGCKTASPILTPALVQSGVSASVMYGVAKYPQARSYLRAVEPIICAVSESTNLAPAEVVAAIEESGALKTPEAVMILNTSLLLYSAAYNALGADAAIKNAPLLQEYLHSVCLGLGQGLATSTTLKANRVTWPTVRYP